MPRLAGPLTGGRLICDQTVIIRISAWRTEKGINTCASLLARRSPRSGPNSPIGTPLGVVLAPGHDGAERQTVLFFSLNVAETRRVSATIEQSDAIYEGRLRPVLVARIRTDSTAAIVEFAQALCLAFAQRFVGIEVGGRYIRVYADDT